MSNSYQKSSELNGFASSSSVSGLNRPVTIGSQTYVWTNPPSVIRSPGQMMSNVQMKPRNVSNPYSNRASISTATRNPVAGRTVASGTNNHNNVRPQKRRKTEDSSLMLDSKHFREAPFENAVNGTSSGANAFRHHPEGIVKEMVKEIDGRSEMNHRPGFTGPSPYTTFPMGETRERPTFPEAETTRRLYDVAQKDIIDLDLDDSNEDLGSPVIPRPSRAGDTSATGNVQLLSNGRKAHASRLSAPSTLQTRTPKAAPDAHEGENVTAKLKVQKEDPHPFRGSQTTLFLAPSSRIARDGNSTARLWGQLGGKLPAACNDAETSTKGARRPSSPRRQSGTYDLLSPKQPQVNAFESTHSGQIDDDEIEEIESADDIADNFGREPSEVTQKSIPISSTSRPQSIVNGARMPTLPTAIPSKGGRHIDFLKQMQFSKSRPKKDAMKPKMTIDRSLTQRRRNLDPVATSSTAYRPANSCQTFSERTFMPVQSCVWGETFIEHEDNEYRNWGMVENRKRHWLNWNNAESKLILENHADTGPSRQLELDCKYLQEAETLFSHEASNCGFYITFPGHVEKDIADDVLEIGLMFRFVTDHPSTMQNVSVVFDFLEKINGKKPRALVGANINIGFGQAEQRAKERNMGSRMKNLPRKRQSPRNGTKERSDDLLSKLLKKRPTPALPADPDPDSESAPIATVRQSKRLQEKEPSPDDSGEVILVYPPTGAGGVHVNKGDLKRLDKDEFLNDTLIELGFKFWMTELREGQPELLQNIHLFSPFFFKKLVNTNNKTLEDEYKSVHKWTAKVDIFQKKFIVIPINESLHWYVLIVYQPENILLPAPPKPSTPPLRTSKRRKKGSNLSMDAEISVITGDEEVVSAARTPETMMGAGEQAQQMEADGSVDTEESEVNNQLRSCSLADIQPRSRSMSITSPESAAVDSIQDSDLQRRPAEQEDVILDLDSDDEHGRGTMVGGGPFDLDKGSTVVIDDSDDERSDDGKVDADEVSTWTRTQTQADSQPEPGLIASSSIVMEVPRETYAESAGMENAKEVEPSATPEEKSKSSTSADLTEDADADDERVEVISVTDDNTTRQQRPGIPAQRFYGTQPLRKASGMPRPRLVRRITEPESSDSDELNLRANCETEERSRTIPTPSQPKKRLKAEPIEIDQDEFDLDPKKAYIFSLDSLGTAHPKALGRIASYLKFEAKAKRGVENPSDPIMRKLQVPVQPNYSDCGLYLLHLTQVFLTNPDQLIRRTAVGAKGMKKEELRELWHDVKVGTMREVMREKILKESEAWGEIKREREAAAAAEKEKEKAKEGVQDGEKEKEKEKTAVVTNAGKDKEPALAAETAKVPEEAAQAQGASSSTKPMMKIIDSDGEIEVSDVIYTGTRKGGTMAPKRRKAANRLR